MTRPKPDDWGTCLCAMYLNPELKLEALATHLNESSFTYRNGIEATDINLLILKIVQIKLRGHQIHKWQKVPNYNVTQVECHLNMQNFLKILTKALQCLKDHLNQVFTQIKAFKEARTETDDFENVATLQIDWSENPKLPQSQEEKSAYYFDNQVSLHAM